MTTANNFFRNVADATANAADALKQRAMGAFNGLRGAAQTTDGTARPYAPGAAAEAKWGAAGSPEAQAYRASQAGGSSTEAAMHGSAANYTPKGLSGMAARVGRAAGPVSSIAEVYNMDKNLQAGENPLKSVGRAALRTGGAMLGGAAGAAGGTLLAPGVGTLAGGVAGGYGGYKVADKVATSLFGEEPKGGVIPTAAAATPAPADGVTPQPATLRTPDGAMKPDPEAMIKGAGVPAEGTGAFKRTTPGNEGAAVSVGTAASNSLAGASAQSESLRAGESGSSGIRGAGPQPLGSNRTDAGYNQPSAIQGAPRDASGRPAPAGAPSGTQSASVSSNGLRDVPVLPAVGWGAPRANRLNMQAQVEQRGQDATYASSVMNRQIQMAQLGRELGKDQEGRLTKQIESHVRNKLEIQDPSMFNDAGKRAAAKENLDKETAAFADRVNFSLQDAKTGKTLQTLNDPEFQQLRLLDKARDAVHNARGGTFQTMRDYFGYKRFDSENLYSYGPDRAEPSVQGGYLVHFRNGNTAHVKEVAGGKFVVLGPNEPVDADTMSLIRPVIEAAKRQR